MKRFFLGAVIAASLFSLATAQNTTASGSLTIESWRNDDLTIWQDTIIPAFNEPISGHSGDLLRRAPPQNITPRSGPSSRRAAPVTSSPADLLTSRLIYLTEVCSSP